MITTLLTYSRTFRRTLFAALVACLASVSPLSFGQFDSNASTVIITGANRGIGLELARQYAEADWNVIATSRRRPGNEGLNDLLDIQKDHPNLVIERIDVTDTAMITAVAEKYADQPIDVLINNAAKVESSFQADLAVVNKSYADIDFDDSRLDFDVNTLGPMRMAQIFMPNIKASKQKKVINVTSFIGSFGYGAPSPMGLNYGASKAALNMYSMKLAEQLRSEGVIVALVEPVLVQSKPGVDAIPMSSPVDIEVAKLRQVIADITMAEAGKITNFTTGEIDPY